MSFTCPQCGQPKRGGLSICLACENRPDTKHTAEPWHYGTALFDELHITGNKNVKVAHIAMDDGEEEAEANAARIVACVNACAGMEDPAKVLELIRQALVHANKLATGNLMMTAETTDDNRTFLKRALRALGG